MGTGLIFAAVVIAWAVFLVPWALRRYDEATRTRSVDTFSRGMRLLRRARIVESDEPSAPAKATDAKANAEDAAVQADAAVKAEVAAKADDADAAVEADEPDGVEPTDPDAEPIAARPALKKSHTTSAPVEPRGPSRAAARAAARRRRRVLGMLLGVTAVVGGLAGLAILPPWSAAIPAAPVIGFLALCRWQVRREDDATWVRRRAGRSVAASTAGDSADDEPTVVLGKASAEAREASGRRDSVEADAAPVADSDLAESTSVAVTVSTDDGGSLWDPLPVTLPTYVSKAKANRTVRTIDLGEPDAWTSGHVEGEQTELPASSEDSSASGDDPDAHRRAVGD